nr:MAG TPA: hypothetical protein [Caudoviricetes sp.]
MRGHGHHHSKRYGFRSKTRLRWFREAPLCC